ncbi:hypothetical protein [Chryseobacterium sp. R2A-55]|uniref:hypothetical protein n=1 Tax=Chryseobacterium sp. R2A-55 TaxID=2744445 RepID=UPI001F45FF5D|nr:hypothetical protein [Chryseobacterium sp. R2A-55]
MLELKEILKAKGVIRFDKDFCDIVGILRQNLYQIQNPEKVKRIQHFTPQHIENAGKYFGADMNFIFGLSPEPFISGQKRIDKPSTKRSTSTSKSKEKTEKQNL